MRTFFLRYLWFWFGLVVVLLSLLMVYLGLWQLERLAQRREINSKIISALEAPPATLDASSDGAALEYRKVQLRGTFDHAQEVLLRNRSYRGRPGYHVLTPLRIEGLEQGVLVDRGWIGLEDADDLAQFNEPGQIEVLGVVRQVQAEGGTLRPVDPAISAENPRNAEWFVIAPARIQEQLPYELLPLYIEREELPAGMEKPIPDPQIEITEKNHLSYAFQWFTFALMISGGYLAMLWHHHRRKPQPADEQQLAAEAEL